MGNKENSAAPEGLKQIETYLPFGGGIQGTRGFIEDQHPWVLQHGTGQGHPLALPA